MEFIPSFVRSLLSLILRYSEVNGEYTCLNFVGVMFSLELSTLIWNYLNVWKFINCLTIFTFFRFGSKKLVCRNLSKYSYKKLQFISLNSNINLFFQKSISQALFLQIPCNQSLWSKINYLQNLLVSFSSRFLGCKFHQKNIKKKYFQNFKQYHRVFLTLRKFGCTELLELQQKCRKNDKKK